MADRMDNVIFRARRVDIKRWKARARASDMTFSEWLRRVVDEGAVYVTSPVESEDARG